MARGIVLLVCNVALTVTAGSIARARSLAEADVYNDLKSSILPGAVLVPGLVVAISRAQEKGFTYIRAS
jgi:intracellular sulfur oxidation DsrE/DsrF family protein